MSPWHQFLCASSRITCTPTSKHTLLAGMDGVHDCVHGPGCFGALHCGKGVLLDLEKETCSWMHYRHRRLESAVSSCYHSRTSRSCPGENSRALACSVVHPVDDGLRESQWAAYISAISVNFGAPCLNWCPEGVGREQQCGIREIRSSSAEQKRFTWNARTSH